MNNLRRLAGACEVNGCDTIYASDRGTLVLQGKSVVAEVELGDGEQAVELPVDLVREALAALEGC
ncbi:hypothetical protein Lesp02_64160 [Lentzea sp. NBRC 105346]|uniref:hypothetical protein n=1 Tax=Lentzea sp. NBRC 105346 TaxID=3032205 RepID=UPI0024A0C2D3|nr:hypothetical protein [Lentzea sp. NBRC 105346]GLZ34229.1 hypothetical protein Lesp02_64160 [Lentzea sp. NBRC 105346]